MSRYYPGFLAAFFLILLRIAIGWHFLYEGWEKVESRIKGHQPFSAEVYLRNATGPLAPFFRNLIPDVDGLERLNPTYLRAQAQADLDAIANKYGFDQTIRELAKKELEKQEQWIAYWFNDPEIAEKKTKYLRDLEVVEKIERDPSPTSYDRERAWDLRRSLEADRKALLEPIEAQEERFRELLTNLASPEQKQAAGQPYQRPNSLDLINALTAYGLVAIGVCLILGFLTTWAALGAALFLTMIYLSMPPWPGTPPNPKAEGHYFIVSKNLIELIACLALAALPTGHWIGLDALFFGARWRRRLAARAARGESAAQTQPTAASA